MSRPIYFVVLVFVVLSQFHGFQNSVMAAGDQAISDKFLGSFKLEKSENFDEFLAAKGVNWFVRKMIQLSSITKIFKKSEAPGKYTAINVSSKGELVYKDWSLNEPFEDKGMDDTKHRITFGVQDDGNTLTEHHVRLEQGGEETYYYTRENDYLVLRMEHEGITARRWLKLQTEKKK